MSVTNKKSAIQQSSEAVSSRKTVERQSLTVGSILKQTREKYNLDLRDVATYLNIRRVHLESIEEARYGDLPGTVYVIGFIKSYSDYLGIDPEMMVNRFKNETGKQVQKIDLDIPVPIAESRLPDTSILITSAILTVAFIIFAFWLFSGSKEIHEKITEVPSPEQIFEQDVLSGLSNQTGNAEVRTIDLGQNIMQENDISIATTSMQGVQETAVVVVERTTSEDDEIVLGDQPSMQEEKLATQTGNSLLATSGRATVYGAGNVDARIAIKARQNSWLEVRDERNSILLSRVLNPEDVYYVPANVKTYLTTGNAGGLEIYIDNKFAGVAGKQGEVLRQYQLTVEGLIAP